MFKKNMGTGDRVWRFLIALLLFAYAYWQSSWIALFFAIFTLFETFMSWCIFYQLIGKNTCPIETKEQNKK